MSRPVYIDCVFHCLSMSKKGGVVMIFPEEELGHWMDDIEEHRRVRLSRFSCRAVSSKRRSDRIGHNKLIMSILEALHIVHPVSLIQLR